jgi:hypothetical protein
MSALRSIYQAARNNTRIRYITDMEFRHTLSQDAHIQVLGEFMEYISNGTHPDDHYEDDVYEIYSMNELGQDDTADKEREFNDRIERLYCYDSRYRSE